MPHSSCGIRIVETNTGSGSTRQDNVSPSLSTASNAGTQPLAGAVDAVVEDLRVRLLELSLQEPSRGNLSEASSVTCRLL